MRPAYHFCAGCSCVALSRVCRSCRALWAISHEPPPAPFESRWVESADRNVAPSVERKVGAR